MPSFSIVTFMVAPFIGLPQRLGRGGFGVERIARQQHHPGPARPRGLRQPGNRPMPRLAQPVPDALGITAEGAAQMQVGRMEKPECVHA